MSFFCTHPNPNTDRGEISWTIGHRSHQVEASYHHACSQMWVEKPCRAVRENIIFMWLAAGQQPDFRTINTSFFPNGWKKVLETVFSRGHQRAFSKLLTIGIFVIILNISGAWCCKSTSVNATKQNFTQYSSIPSRKRMEIWWVLIPGFVHALSIYEWNSS